MTVTYNATVPEYWRGIFLCNVRHPYQRWPTLLAVILLLFGAVQYFIIAPHFVTALLYASGFLVKNVGAFFVFIAFYIYSKAGKPCTETITPERFICMTPNRVESVPWKKFVQIEQTQDQLLFFTVNRNYFIPRRAFGSTDEAATFFWQAVVYWQTAKGKMSATPQEGVWPPAPRRDV